MPLNRLTALLRDRVGLDANSLGPTFVANAVRRRMATLDVIDSDAYCSCVYSSESEFWALVEQIVVCETWFLREHEAFAGLTAFVSESAGRRKLRILSLPCATGEEPYSMGLSLREAGVDAGRVTIHAADISRQALGVAQRAEYGMRAFRGTSEAFRIRYFDEVDAMRFRLKDSVRPSVRWHHGNILNAGNLAHEGPFDVVWCRNLLIYMDPLTQCQVLGELARILRCNGLLVVAASEAMLPPREHFQRLKHFCQFTFRRNETRFSNLTSWPISDKQLTGC